MSTCLKLWAAIVVATIVTGCGTVKEKTAPCKRPAELSSFVDDPRHDCGPMHAVNDPASVFATIGVTDPAQP